MTKKELVLLNTLKAKKADKLSEADYLIREYYLATTPSARKSAITKKMNKLEKDLVNIHIAINHILGGVR